MLSTTPPVICVHRCLSVALMPAVFRAERSPRLPRGRVARAAPGMGPSLSDTVSPIAAARGGSFKELLVTMRAWVVAAHVFAASPTLAGDPVFWNRDGSGAFSSARPPQAFDGVTGKNIRWKAALPNWSNSSPIVVDTPRAPRPLLLSEPINYSPSLGRTESGDDGRAAGPAKGASAPRRSWPRGSWFRAPAAWCGVWTRGRVRGSGANRWAARSVRPWACPSS